MGMFTKVSGSVFDELQLEAGLILKNFSPEAPEVNDGDIVCATTGGITVSCVPSYIDMGADVDNCPENTKELTKLDSWACKISFTALNVTPATLKLALGAADVNGNGITPRSELKPEDFADIWWVGDRSDGGMAAACLKNALSTGGLSLKTTKKGKGQLAVELTGYVSIDALDEVPMQFFVKEAA